MKLYVGNLSYTTTEDTLREAFSNYGDVISVQIMRDRFTEQSKGFGFVEMGTDIQSERAIGGMNGKSLDGRRIRVSVAVEKAKTDGEARRFIKKDGEQNSRREDFRRERRDEWRPKHSYKSERPSRQSQAEEY